MLTYSLQHKSSAPLYAQLYQAIKRDILSGRLKGGEKLPSKRRFAEHLGVSKVTVETAYQQLLAEGYLTVREKVGYFVESITPVTAALSCPKQPASAFLPEKEPEPSASANAAALFPSSVWAKLMRRALMEQSGLLQQPLDGRGLPALRNAISKELRRSRGMDVHPAQILIGSGAEYFYNILIQLLGRTRRYGLESPGHRKIAAVCRANDAAVIPLSLDENGIALDSLYASGADVLHLSPSHQYPTGIVTPVRRRQALLQWAQAADRYLIEDDYDAEFRFSGRPIPTMQSLDQTGCVVYLNTFSKTLSPALRISYLVLPPSLMERYQTQLGFYSCTVPSLEQQTLAYFLEEGHFERHLGRMLKHYRSLRAALLQALQAAGLQVSATDAGLHFLLYPASEQELLCRRLAVGGLSVQPLASCTLDQSMPAGFVVDFSRLYDLPAVLQQLHTL